MNKIISIKENTSSEIIEKKSRFIGNLIRVDNEEDAKNKIEEIKKKYYDAKHNCFAFIINGDEKIERFSDDGEPQGTAGKPLLNILEKNNLSNVLLIVIRYFGGILLGTGGLTHAYNDTGLKAVEEAKLVYLEEGLEVELKTSYDNNNDLKYLLSKYDLEIKDINYDNEVVYTIEISNEEYEKVTNNHDLVQKISNKNILRTKLIQKDMN